MRTLMHFVFAVMACLLGNTIHAEAQIANSYHFTIREKPYPLATYFSINSGDTYPGVVKKSLFRVRTNYDLSNKDGWQATGIKRMLSLGSAYAWATEIDIYDTNWEYIGMIDGQVASTAAARFSIYDKEDKLCAIAYMDHSLKSYTLTYPESEAFPIAEIHMHKEIQGQLWWEVMVYDAAQIDERIVRIFAAMICDIQPEIELYYTEIDVEDLD